MTLSATTGGTLLLRALGARFRAGDEFDAAGEARRGSRWNTVQFAGLSDDEIARIADGLCSEGSLRHVRGTVYALTEEGELRWERAMGDRAQNARAGAVSHGAHRGH